MASMRRNVHWTGTLVSPKIDIQLSVRGFTIGYFTVGHFFISVSLVFREGSLQVLITRSAYFSRPRESNVPKHSNDRSFVQGKDPISESARLPFSFANVST